MPDSLSHQFVSAKADGGDASLVRPGNWNAAHKLDTGADGGLVTRDASVANTNMLIMEFTGMTTWCAYGVTAGAEPAGWLLCDGRAVSRTTYARLFGKISTTWGVGDGSTTFNLPDMRDRVPMGASGTKAVGSGGGSETVNLAHTHTLSGANTGGPSALQEVQAGVGVNVADGGHTHGVSGGTTSALSASQSVLPQYRAGSWLIKT